MGRQSYLGTITVHYDNWQVHGDQYSQIFPIQLQTNAPTFSVNHKFLTLLLLLLCNFGS